VSEGDLRAVACNITEASGAVSRGSIAYVIQLAGDRIRLLVRSRRGRWIYKWLKVSALANFRFKTISPQSPLRNQVGRAVTAEFFTESDLAALALRGAGQGLRFR
jgi:hypothetical protein